MFSLEREIAQFRDRGLLDDAAASRLIAVERREVVNVWPELRFLTWAGVMLIAAGVSVLVARHLQDLGPVIIASGIAIAAACYAWTEWKRTRGAALVDDFVLLLGSLLLSADVGYIESQWHVFGSAWPRHLLILTIVHAFVAYRYKSRLVLSLSLSALAGYLGVERRAEALLFGESTDMALRGYVAAALILAWRQIDRWRRGVNPFTTVFEHFAANLSFYASIVLMTGDQTRVAGCLIALVLAAFCAWYGVRTRQEMFVIYAWIVATIAIDVLIAELLREGVLIAFCVILSSIVLIVALFVTHARFKEIRA